MTSVKESHTCECGRQLEIEMDMNEPDQLFKCKTCGRYVVGYIGTDWEDQEPYIGIVEIENKSVERLQHQNKMIERTI